MTKSFPFSSFSGHFRFHLYRCLMSWPRQCLPDGLQSDPSLQRLPENILRALEAIFGLLVVESLIFGWIFGGYWCHAFVIWPILGCFYIFFAEKQSHCHHCLNMSWLGCIMLMGFGSRWWWQSTKGIASLKHSTRKDAFPKGNFTFQPAFFWCYVSFRECIKSIGPYQISPGHGRKTLPQNDGSWHCDLGWKWSKTWLTKHKRDEFLAGMGDF